MTQVKLHKKSKQGRRPTALSMKILLRFKTDKEIDDLVSDYRDAHLIGRSRVRPPTDIDKRIYAKFRSLQSISQTAEAFKCSTSAVYTAIARCSVAN